MEFFLLAQTELLAAFKLVLAFGLGALIGMEREWSNKPAGLRTHSFVSMGAALFTIVALNFFGPGEADAMSRVLQGIIAGIGFLGAGIIFQSQARIRGLTTAAEIWTLAGIGMLVGLGFYVLAVSATVLSLLILGPLKRLEGEDEETAL